MIVFWPLYLLLVVAAIPSLFATEVYVQPLASSDSLPCPAQPCLTLNEYANLSFTDNTTFKFLPGIHELDFQLKIENASDINFLAFTELHNNESVQVIFSPFANITFTDCDGIEITGLEFVLNGEIAAAFSAFVFDRTTASLSDLFYRTNGSTLWTAIRATSSQVEVSDVQVIGLTGLNGAALYAFNSTVSFAGENTFVNNTATDGATVAFYDSLAYFYGNLSFLGNIGVPNSRPSAGAVLGSNSILLFNGTFSFRNNQARFTFYSFLTSDYASGALVAILGTRVTFAVQSKAEFIGNSGVIHGGAIILTRSCFLWEEFRTAVWRYNLRTRPFQNTLQRRDSRKHCVPKQLDWPQ